MNDDLFAEPSWNNWRHSLQRLAAWMTRGNRNPEPNRWSDEARVEVASRVDTPSRQPYPPRP